MSRMPPKPSPFAGTAQKNGTVAKAPAFFDPGLELPSRVASALASLPTSLIEIVVDYARSFVAARNGYRRDSLVPASWDVQATIQATDQAFAVRKGDGSVICWGNASRGGACSAVKGLNNVKAICGTDSAFAAIVGDDHTVICWGNPKGGGDCSAVASELTHVEGICATEAAFAALREDGTVVTWGDKDMGGDSSSVQSRLKGVSAIYSTACAFAAVLHDGTVETWGSENYGGLIPPAVKERLKQVQCMSGTLMAFAALMADGTVESWGCQRHSQTSHTERDVKFICASGSKFAALKKDGTVVTWGDKATLGGMERWLKQVVLLCAGGSLFTAVRSDGMVVTWGPQGAEHTEPGKLTDAVAIHGAHRAFAVIRRDGTVTTWGEKRDHRGSSLYPFGVDRAEVQSELKQVVAIASAGTVTSAFAALRSDGKVVTWPTDGSYDLFYLAPSCLKPQQSLNKYPR